MKDPITTPGKTYAVTSPNGCTVTTEDGLTLAEIEAGKQGYFVAVSGKVQLSDDSAILTQLFKLAPQQKLAILGVLGGGDPAWLKALRAELTAMLDGSAFELAWLAKENMLVVHTDRVDDAMLAAVKATAESAVPAGVEIVQYNHNMEISWRDINKYAECTNIEDMLAVNPDFKNDVTSDGAWIYPLPEMVNFNQRYPNNDYRDCGLVGSKTVKIVDIVLPKALSLESCFRDMPNLEHLKVSATAATTTNSTWSSSVNIKTIEFYLPKAGQIHCGTVSGIGGSRMLEYVKIYAPLATTAEFRYCPKLTTIDAEFPSLSDVIPTYGGFATGAILNKESVLKVLTSIPAYTSGTHRLQFGVHVDHKTDSEVLEAIANAESKGWTLTVQWNGTPTAQASVTYGLRKPPIYARVSEMERPDGTTERVLDWGHYVTDPTGYEEFRSVEAAREYFGLPEEPLTETE